MLRKEQNDLLTQTGPGTPMGALFRSYWLPAMLASELPENGCPPVRVKLLSERLIAWRDGKGNYALMDEFCAHRGTSLWVGRNEDDGLRCPYHGWKYDIDRPVHRGAVGAGGVRLLREDQAQVLSADQARRRAVDLHGPAGASSRRCPNSSGARCRWSRATSPSGCRSATGCRRSKAASIPATAPGCTAASSSHDPLYVGAKGNDYTLGDVQPHFEVVESPGGLLIGARRNAEAGKYYWRITQWIMPCMTMIPPRGDHPDRRPLLGADRRRELLGLELGLSRDPPAHAGGADGDGQRLEPPRDLRGGQRPTHLARARPTRTTTT